MLSLPGTTVLHNCVGWNLEAVRNIIAQIISYSLNDVTH